MGKINFGEGRDDLVAASKDSLTAGEVKEIPIHMLQPGQHQPRTYFDDESLAELAESIKQQGILQPILVRDLPDGKIEIVAGERRWRAAQKAGLQIVPCIKRSLSEENAGAIALIENIQRENLNILEEANAYSKLIKLHGLTQEQLSKRVGKSRSAIANIVRLLTLTENVRNSLSGNQIDAGHAKALLPLSAEQQDHALQIILAKSFTVRQVEQLVKKLLFLKSHQSESKKAITSSHIIEASYNERLQACWESDVKVSFTSTNQDAGTVNLKFNTREQLHSLISLLEANLEKVSH